MYAYILNATNISGVVATSATRFLYDLDLN